MSDKRNDGGPAFIPVSIRDYFAAAATDSDLIETLPATVGEAMQLAAQLGIDPSDWTDACSRLRCWARYRHADAMLRERERKPT